MVHITAGQRTKYTKTTPIIVANKIQDDPYQLKCGINSTYVWLMKITLLQPKVCGKNRDTAWCQTCKHKPTENTNIILLIKNTALELLDETLPFILREIERSYTASKRFMGILQLKIMGREDFNFAVESTCYNILAISTERHT